MGPVRAELKMQPVMEMRPQAETNPVPRASLTPQLKQLPWTKLRALFSSTAAAAAVEDTYRQLISGYGL